MAELAKKDLEAVLISMLSTVKNMALYPPEHPSVQSPLKKSFERVDNLLRANRSLTLGMVDEVLVFEGTPFYTSHVAIRELEHRFTAFKINAIEIRDGLTRAEYAAFLKLLSEDPKLIEEEGGFSPALRSRGIERVVAKDVREVYTNAISTIGDVLQEARLGRIPRADKAKAAVADLQRFLSTDRPALIGLTMLKSYDAYLFNHSVNVSVLSLALAQGLSVPEDDLADIGLAGILHDIGKTATPKSIILKPGTLNPEEWEMMRMHPIKGAEIVQKMEGVSELVVKMVREHHVNFNLKGYPELDPGQRPHPYSKIITVADSYDAITTLRPYQKPFQPHEAMKILENLCGKAIDPQYFEEFIKILGIYPIGTLVRLDTNEVAVVVETFVDFPMKPRVKIVFDPDGKTLPVMTEIDLSKPTSYAGETRNIVSTVDPMLVNVDPENLLNG